MDLWTDYAYLQIVNIAKLDLDYQDILQQCKERKEVYTRIMKNMSEEDRLAVDDYVASCEELLYRFAQLAYQFGIMEGRMNKQSLCVHAVWPA